MVLSKWNAFWWFNSGSKMFNASSFFFKNSWRYHDITVNFKGYFYVTQFLDFIVIPI